MDTNSIQRVGINAIGSPSAGMINPGLSHITSVKYVNDETVLIIDASIWSDFIRAWNRLILSSVTAITAVVNEVESIYPFPMKPRIPNRAPQNFLQVNRSAWSLAGCVAPTEDLFPISAFQAVTEIHTISPKNDLARGTPTPISFISPAPSIPHTKPQPSDLNWYPST